MKCEVYNLKDSAWIFRRLLAQHWQYDYCMEKRRNNWYREFRQGGRTRVYVVNDNDVIVLFLVVRLFKNGEYVVSGTLELDRNDLYYCPTESVARLREAFGVLINRMRMDGCKTLHWGFLKAESPATIFLQELGAEKGASRPNVRIKFQALALTFSQLTAFPRGGSVTCLPNGQCELSRVCTTIRKSGRALD